MHASPWMITETRNSTWRVKRKSKEVETEWKKKYWMSRYAKLGSDPPSWKWNDVAALCGSNAEHFNCSCRNQFFFLCSIYLTLFFTIQIDTNHYAYISQSKTHSLLTYIFNQKNIEHFGGNRCQVHSFSFRQYSLKFLLQSKCHTK